MKRWRNAGTTPDSETATQSIMRKRRDPADERRHQSKPCTPAQAGFKLSTNAPTRTTRLGLGAVEIEDEFGRNKVEG